LAAEALSEYLDVNERQIAGIKQAVASLDRGGGSAARSRQGMGRFMGERERALVTRSLAKGMNVIR
jgi:hypothetical protein